MADLQIHPLTPDRIPDFVTLFGPEGACYGCWCTSFLLRPKTRQAMSNDERREVMLDRIRRGPPPGLLLYDGGAPVGWMQIGPRSDTPEWNNPGRVSTPLPDAPADDPAVWSITCFFVEPKARRDGVMAALIAAAVKHARRHGARIVEAYPRDSGGARMDSASAYVGALPPFLEEGFREAARRRPRRPIMRRYL